MITDIAFIDQNTAWAVGRRDEEEPDVQQPIILHTTDGGTTWTEQPSGINQGNFNAVAFQDADTGCVAGQEFASGYPLILCTQDGGTTWSQGTTDPMMLGSLDALVFNTDGTIWSTGIEFDTFQSLILRSNDNGTTWTAQPHPSGEGSLIDITFPTPMIGYAVGTIYGSEPGLIPTPLAVQTRDGGDTWTEMTIPGEGTIADASFIDTDTGWVTGGTGEEAIVLKTTDGGTTWISQSDTITGTFGSSIHFTSPQQGVLAANQYSAETWNGMVYHTDDGGATWTLAATPLTDGKITDVVAFSIEDMLLIYGAGLARYTPPLPFIGVLEIATIAPVTSTPAILGLSCLAWVIPLLAIGLLGLFFILLLLFKGRGKIPFWTWGIAGLALFMLASFGLWILIRILISL